MPVRRTGLRSYQEEQQQRRLQQEEGDIDTTGHYHHRQQLDDRIRQANLLENDYDDDKNRANDFVIKRHIVQHRQSYVVPVVPTMYYYYYQPYYFLPWLPGPHQQQPPQNQRGDILQQMTVENVKRVVREKQLGQFPPFQRIHDTFTSMIEYEPAAAAAAQAKSKRQKKHRRQQKKTDSPQTDDEIIIEGIRILNGGAAPRHDVKRGRYRNATSANGGKRRRTKDLNVRSPFDDKAAAADNAANLTAATRVGGKRRRTKDLNVTPQTYGDDKAAAADNAANLTAATSVGGVAKDVSEQDEADDKYEYVDGKRRRTKDLNVTTQTFEDDKAATADNAANLNATTSVSGVSKDAYVPDEADDEYEYEDVDEDIEFEPKPAPGGLADGDDVAPPPEDQRFNLGTFGWHFNRSKDNTGDGIFVQQLKVRRGGVAIAGPGGIATAGSGGTAIVGPGGFAYTHPGSVAIAGSGSKVVAVDPDISLSDIIQNTNNNNNKRNRTRPGLLPNRIRPPRVGRVVAVGPVIYYNRG